MDRIGTGYADTDIDSDRAIYWALRNIVSEARGTSWDGVSASQLFRYGNNHRFFSNLSLGSLRSRLSSMESKGVVESGKRGKEKIYWPGDFDTEME